MTFNQLDLLDTVLNQQACPPSAPPHQSAPESSYVTPTPAPPAVLHKKREALEAYAWKGWTLQLEKVACGKATCKTCPHGPYWYAYRRQGARLVSKYIGKRLNLENIESDRPQASDRPQT